MNTKAIDNLIEDLDLKPSIEPFGANGLVKPIAKRLVETALEAEMEEHLGDPKASEATNPGPTPATAPAPSG